MAPTPQTPALACLRTPGATNVGADKDSETRQRMAIAAYARRAGLEVVGEHYDAAVSGADPLDARTGFTDLLARAEVDNIRMILVEAASRFARDLMVQEAEHTMLARMGIALVAADGPDAFTANTPTAVLWCASCSAPSASSSARPWLQSSRRPATGAAPRRAAGLRAGLGTQARRPTWSGRRTASRGAARATAPGVRCARSPQRWNSSATGRRFGPGQVKRLLAARAASYREKQALGC